MPCCASSVKKRMSNKKKSYRVSGFERFLHALLAWPIRLFFRVRVSGRENIPDEGGCVLCANHVGMPDILVLSAVFPARRMPRYMGKQELFRIPVLSFLLRKLGGIPVRRQARDVQAIRTAIDVAAEGEVFAIFPQGTRHPGENPADTSIKSGVAMIAARAEAPILPVAIRMKKQRYAFLRRVYVSIGKPLPLEQLGLLQDGSYAAAAELAFHEVCRVGGFLPPALPEGEKS